MNAPEAPNATSSFTTVFDDSKPSKLALYRYMDQYALSIEDTEATVNFISLAPQYRKRFYVPDDAVPQLMKLMNNCCKEGIPYHFYELQDVNEIQATGLMFEFQFETDQAKIEFETILQGFIRVLFRDILTQWVEFSKGKEDHYCFYMTTKNPFYDPKTLKFKSTFRVIIPSIMLDDDVRYFIYQRVWQSKELKLLFDKKINSRVRDCFKREMRTAPITMIGSCDIDCEEPLYLDSVHRVTIENGETDGDSVSLSSLDSRFSNVIHEASVSHVCENGSVAKNHYVPTPACSKKMLQDMNDKQLFQMAYDEAKAAYLLQSVTDSSIERMNDMISMLGAKWFEDVDSWLEIIKSLASNGSRYYCVAVMMTKDRAKTLIGWEDFVSHWSEAINSIERSKYSCKALRYWASCDSPSKMHRYVDDAIKKMLVRDVRDSLVQGRIHHSHIASYLHFMFKNVYVTSSVTKTSVHWYEFTTAASNDIEPGQLYKWRCIGNQPDSLSTFITQDFKDIAVKVHSDLKSLCASTGDAEKDDPKVKHARSLFKAYDKAIVAIFNNGFKRSVIEESTTLFKRNNFIKNLDKIPNIMGVGNGVLEFNGPDVKLLSHYHTYPISLYTETKYVEYDEKSPYVQTMYKMLYSLVPEDEVDALEFLLYFFSTSLDWHKKESLFLIIHGRGCHAINTPIRMFDGSIKMVQDVKVGEKLMGDDNTPRVVQQLFNGEDEMVRIVPHKGDSFVVNENHILSLKSLLNRDVIDIKIVDLQKSDTKWRNHLCLYKPDGTLDGFTIESVGSGDYYGFELDGNHRYLTGDYFVHHNSNGKSVLMELFRATLGNNYARTIPLSFITDQGRARSGAADPVMMDLKSARLAIYAESDRDEKVNVAKVKDVTGGEEQTGRQLFGEQENFKVNCNHIVTTNNQFKIESTEHAVWRRFISYKFKFEFHMDPNPNEKFQRKRDPELINMILEDKRYHSAFLSILVHYRSKLYANYGGQILRVPRPTILKETEEYRQGEDIFQRYIMQRIYFYKGKQQSMDELVSNFRSYYRIENGEQYKAKTAQMISTFRTTLLEKHIKESGGLFNLNDLYSCNEHESPVPGSILFSEWIKKKNAPVEEDTPSED